MAIKKKINCQKLAEELRNGQRKWYLNPFNSMYFAHPLSENNINEFGTGYHLTITQVELEKMVINNKIINSPFVSEVLSYY